MINKILVLLLGLVYVSGLCPKSHQLPLLIGNNLSKSYCVNLFGNDLEIYFIDSKTANITANVFGSDLSCDNEKYLFSNNRLLFTNNQSDCLNVNLNSFGGCPCPPNITYDSKLNTFTISGTDAGDIILKKC